MKSRSWSRKTSRCRSRLPNSELPSMIFRGKTTDLMPEPPRCAFPSCTDWGGHDHHITYEPPVTKRLCVRHHEEITIINGQQARKYRRTLSNKHRWWAWYQWIEGELKARRTRKALEYTEEWTAGTAREVEVAEVKTPEMERALSPKRVRSRKTRKRKKSPTRRPKKRSTKGKKSKLR
jgi:hypothetical protein